MASSLIRGKYVVAKVTSRTEAEVIADGAVFQENGIVVDVGPYAELAARHRPDQVLGSSDHVVVPGFVNGHHHVGLTPFQLGSPDYALELWFASRMAARAVDPYLDTLYSPSRCLSPASPPCHTCTACATARPPGGSGWATGASGPTTTSAC